MRWFRHVRILQPLAICGALPRALQVSQCVTMPKLSPSYLLLALACQLVLMTDGCHGAAGITVIDSRLTGRLIRSRVAVLASGCLSACTPLRPAGNSRGRGGDLSKRTIFPGPHAWRYGSRPSPSAQAGQELNAARGCCVSPSAGIKGRQLVAALRELIE